jgi:hypothetical protein
LILDPPFSTFDFFAAGHKAFGDMPENVPQARPKPRASSLTSDAREIAYMMSNTPRSNPHSENPERVDSIYTTETGRVTEDITVAMLESLDPPIEVQGRQICIGHERCSLSHAQGPLAIAYTGHSDGQAWIDGVLVGTEFKHFGRFAFKELARDGLLGSEKGLDILCQGVLYGHALGWQQLLIVVMSQDASSMRLEFKQKAFAGRDDIHPKMQHWLVDLVEAEALLLKPLLRRAKWFCDWYENDGNPANVAWEHRPDSHQHKGYRGKMEECAFPWPWSEWQDRAIADGQGTLVAPPLPAILEQHRRKKA